MDRASSNSLPNNPVAYNEVEGELNPENHTQGADKRKLDPRQHSVYNQTKREKEEARLREERPPAPSRWCTYIHPSNHTSKRFDLVVTIALLFTTAVTPYEVALLQTRLNARFWVNCVVDLVYFCDMCRNFFLAYETSAGILVVSPCQIAYRYFRQWFIIDLLSIIPYDGMTLAMGPSMERMKTVKVIRLLRLLKLAKVMNGSALYDRYKAEFSISLNTISLIKNCLKMVVVSHWFACAWILIAMLQCDHECMLDPDRLNKHEGTPSWLH